MSNEIKLNFFNVLFWLILILSIGFFCAIHFFKFNPHNIIAYLSIVCCCAVGIFTFILSKSKVNFWLMLGLTFTLLADTFLVLIQSQQTLAMVLFSITQICYFMVLYDINQNKKLLQLNLALRGGLFIILSLVAILVLGSAFSLLVFISMFYFSNLFFNLIFSGINIKKSPLLFCGFLLFLLCDILIGLQVLTTIITVPALENILSYFNTYFDLAWVFYLPSQLLITLSSIIYAKNLFIKNPNSD